MAEVGLFFATDLHGSDVCFRKFLSAAKVYQVNVLVMGGDLTGKQLIPVVEQTDGTFKVSYQGSIETVSKEDLDGKMTMLTNSGQYPYLTNLAEMEELKQDRSKVESIFRRLMLERLEKWMILANERLKGSGITLYLTGGNDDVLEIEDLLKKYESENVVNAEARVVTIAGKYEMASTGYTNITPWHCPREMPEEELEQRITKICDQVKDCERAVFNLHCPPYDTPLDYAPKLDGNLRVVAGGGGSPEMIPVGSKAVKKTLEKYQPLLGLHGHIHESRGFVKIGRTLCLNPGSEYGEGAVSGAYVVLADKKVKLHVYTHG
jgi:Icc-related predicted phosphoesterase